MSHEQWFDRLSLVIDGYNVLFLTPLMLSANGKFDLESSRKRLEYFVALTLSPQQLCRSAIVYDAKQQSSVAPKIIDAASNLKIVFATNVNEADKLIEEIIALHARPKQLTVVTSDRKIQSTARSYRAGLIDSRDWYDSLIEKIDPTHATWIVNGSAPSPELHKLANRKAVETQKPINSDTAREKARRMLSDNDLAFDDFEMPE